MNQSLKSKITAAWEYCECGCKGYRNRLMTDYWSYTPLGQDWILQVWCGHALMGEQIGMLPWKWKFEDATDLILAHAKEHSALLQEIL